ncbi:Mnd1 family-domain-containing protein [Chytriomyces sp. MP71]|nr:Mnd1 family-domain-containing protein [Chytriomyces sp. MP71]
MKGFGCVRKLVPEMSGRKKGLSNDEKKVKLLELFHESVRTAPYSRDVWILKDLEKTAAKEKGIVLQTVKDVLDQLVVRSRVVFTVMRNNFSYLPVFLWQSDGLVTMEKIGISNYFWSFPGAAAIKRKQTLEEVEEQMTKLKKRNVELDESIENAQVGREETVERTALLASVQDAKDLQKSMKAELVQFKDCDPALIDAKNKAAEIAKVAANRWTDNMFSLQSYCCNQFNMASADFNKHFSVPADFDNL